MRRDHRDIEFAFVQGLSIRLNLPTVIIDIGREEIVAVRDLHLVRREGDTFEVHILIDLFHFIDVRMQGAVGRH